MGERFKKGGSPQSPSANGERSAVELSDVDAHLPELPTNRGEWISLLARDPSTLHCQWHVSDAYRRAVKDAGGEDFCLRVYDVSDTDRRQASTPATEITFAEEQSKWYIPVPRSDRSYCAEIGYRADARWLPLARSHAVNPPPERPSLARRRRPVRAESPVYATFKPEPVAPPTVPLHLPHRAPAVSQPRVDPSAPPRVSRRIPVTPTLISEPLGRTDAITRHPAAGGDATRARLPDEAHAATPVAPMPPDAAVPVTEPARWRPIYRGTPSILPFAPSSPLLPRAAHHPGLKTSTEEPSRPNASLPEEWTKPGASLDWATYAEYLYRYVLGRDPAMDWSQEGDAPLLGDSDAVSRYLSACERHYFGETRPNYALIDRLLAEAQAEMLDHLMTLSLDECATGIFAGASEHSMAQPDSGDGPTLPAHFTAVTSDRLS